MSIHALYLEHRDTLIHTVQGIVGCKQTAEDLSQEAYLRLYEAQQNQEVNYPKPFLFQIGKNLALDHLRKQRIRQPFHEIIGEDESLADLDVLPALLPSLEQQVAAQQEVEFVIAALAELPERRREILVLHKFHHWDYARIGEHFGISVSAVEKNIYKAIRHLLARQQVK
jgi:RNA polymerase sigma factor (sigma-70 family)